MAMYVLLIYCCEEVINLNTDSLCLDCITAPVKLVMSPAPLVTAEYCCHAKCIQQFVLQFNQTSVSDHK